MAPDLGHAQPAQVVPVPAITAAADGGGDGMKEESPGSYRQGWSPTVDRHSQQVRNTAHVRPSLAARRLSRSAAALLATNS